MILVVGDVMEDVLVRPMGAPAPGTDQAAVITRAFGGSAANIASWLGRAGIPTRFAGRVGAADLAIHADSLRAHGVDARLAGDAARDTGRVVALLGADGARGFFTDRSANLGLCEADLPDALLQDARALHVSGHVFFTPGPREAARRLMAAAAARGISVSVDAGSAGWLEQAGAAAFRDWTQGARLCFANGDEAALLGDGYETLVVTRGAAGAEAHEGGLIARVAALPIAIEDGTGAGDAFAAGFLAARLAGSSVKDCLASGALCAARCLALPGGRPR